MAVHTHIHTVKYSIVGKFTIGELLSSEVAEKGPARGFTDFLMLVIKCDCSVVRMGLIQAERQSTDKWKQMRLLGLLPHSWGKSSRKEAHNSIFQPNEVISKPRYRAQSHCCVAVL